MSETRDLLDRSEPLRAVATRGGVIEKEYLIDVFCCDAGGNRVLRLGESDRLVFPRSAVKIIQALETIHVGAARRYGLSGGEIALMCASHDGEAAHVAATKSILTKIGLRPDHLACGCAWPRCTASHRALVLNQRTPGPMHHNCSGKHAGGLAWVSHVGEEVKHYTHPDHPLQRKIAGHLCRFTGENALSVTALDGCSYPTYALPLKNWARAFARIAHPDSLGTDLAASIQTLLNAVARNDRMVGGENSFVSRFTRQFGSRLYVKNGADGVMGAALFQSGLGLLLKVRSGEDTIARLALAALLEHLGALTEDEAASWRSEKRTNANGREVGKVRIILD